MYGWNSFDSVATFQTAFLISGSLTAAVVVASGATALHYARRWHELIAVAERARARYLPRWKDCDVPAVLQNTFAEIAILGIFLLMALGYASSQYGKRKVELVEIAHSRAMTKAQGEQDLLRRSVAERDQRIAAISAEHDQRTVELGTERDARSTAAHAVQQILRESEVRHLAEQAALRRELELAQQRRASAASERETRLAGEIETLRGAADQAEKRHAAEIAGLRKSLEGAAMRRVAVTESLRWEVKQAEAKASAEIERLQDQLTQAERKLASLQTHRRLSDDEKIALINALSPFPGQRVVIAAIDGDDDGRGYAADFAEVFEAAGWVHPQVSYKRWDRDPVGVEITLNEHDGRAGRVSTAVGALINIARKLSLTDGNTIYMAGEVPLGEVQVKIGKKLPR